MIDPYDRKYHDVPLWVVYSGPINGIGLMCLKINNATGTPSVWGYSVYRNSPGFRTLGSGFRSFMERYERADFFADLDEAVEHMKVQVAPSPKLVKAMREKKRLEVFHEISNYSDGFCAD
jgi:hypothetical protein